MKTSTNPEREFELSLFCGQVGDAWRIHVWPGWLPPFLRSYFDADGEACPVFIDLEQLEREMSRNGLKYVRRDSPIGGVELTAEGQAAMTMARWLSASLASSYQEAPSLAEDVTPADEKNSAG